MYFLKTKFIILSPLEIGDNNYSTKLVG